MKLTKNFSLSEFTKSSTATRLDIDNTPNKTQIDSIQLLTERVLQPIRDHFGRVRINSGFRILALNRALKSSDTSQHVDGEAADIEVPGVSNFELALWIRDNLEFDKVILEFYQSGIDDSGWVHVSFRDHIDGNRFKAYTISKQNKKTITEEGLIE